MQDSMQETLALAAPVGESETPNELARSRSGRKRGQAVLTLESKRQ